jgi:hypothetical protein
MNLISAVSISLESTFNLTITSFIKKRRYTLASSVNLLNLYDVKYITTMF